jgi:hypothetical protein
MQTSGKIAALRSALTRAKSKEEEAFILLTALLSNYFPYIISVFRDIIGLDEDDHNG